MLNQGYGCSIIIIYGLVAEMENGAGIEWVMHPHP